MKQFDTQEAFLLDMLEYYTVDPNSRRNYSGSSCRYTPLMDTSEGCAIGRCIESDLAKVLDNIFPSGVGNEKVYDLLPDWMQKLGQDFLRRCQYLHDTNNPWCAEGLTEIGKDKVKNTLKDFNINPEPFLKFLN